VCRKIPLSAPCEPLIPYTERKLVNASLILNTECKFGPAEGKGDFGGFISTGDLADFLLSEALAGNFVGVRVGISHGPPAHPALSADDERACAL
jgi:hypothetical protein